MVLSSPIPRNPNYPHEFSRKAPAFAVPWLDFVPGANGENYKEFSTLLPNRQGLKKADCFFWSKYIRSLKASAGREAWSRGGQVEGGWVSRSSAFSALVVHEVRAAYTGSTGSLGCHQSSPLGGEAHSLGGSSLPKASCSDGGRRGEVRERGARKRKLRGLRAGRTVGRLSGESAATLVGEGK